MFCSNRHACADVEVGEPEKVGEVHETVSKRCQG